MELHTLPEDRLTNQQRSVLIDAVNIVKNLIRQGRVTATANEQRDLTDSIEVLENGAR